MRPLRLLLLAVLVLALAAPAAHAQAQVPVVKLPGGGQIKVNLPKPKGSKAKGKAKKRKSRRTSTVRVGIADEKATMFTDPRFLALGITTARRSVAWDVFEYDWATAELEDWMNAARAAGVRPLITFGRSRVYEKLHAIPTRAQMRATFRQFRARWPWVTDFVASNESNYSDPGFKRPALAARYYLDMRRACRTCRIAAATLLEVPGREKYLKKWVRRFVRTAKHRPRYWAIHNYVSVNGFSLKGTKRMLRVTKKGQIWVTEVGGLVSRRSSFAGKIKMKEGVSHAARVTRFIFDRMLRVSRRIKRVYLYHWDAASPTDSWDSGLVNHDGTARGALDVVQARLTKLGKRPRASRRRR